MKKIFLLLCALVVGVFTSVADSYTLDFVGSEDLYGLTRQKTHAANFQTDYEIVQNGIDFKFSTNAGAGFALTDCTGGTTAESQKKYMSGLILATSSKVNVDVQVPGGKITGVKVIVSTTSNTVEVPFTEYGETESTQNVTSEKVNDYRVYSWTWSNNDYTGDRVSFVLTGGMSAMMNTFFSYVRSIEVTYTPDLGGKLPADLSFNKASAEGIVGETFNAPTLSNPHNLPLIWTSSKESVATVNESGEVTLVGPGTATITVATDGNDNYGAGSAKYELTSIGVANNIPELLTNAPDINQQVKVNFPMTVTFANNSSVWVLDSEGNATKIVSTKNFESTETSASNVYEVGDIIPAGWMAINNSREDCWQGLTGDATERAEVIYPEVESINWTDDAYRVVILKNVTFTKFPNDLDGDTFTTQAGDSYKFVNTFQIAHPDAIGTFDVTVVVQNTRASKYLSIVNYAQKEKTVPAYPEAKDLVVAVNGEGSVSFDEDEEEIVVASKVAEDNAVISLTVPEGWDNFIYMDYSNPGVSPQADDGEWMPVADLQATGMVLGNQITIPVKEEGVNAMYGVMLVLGDEAFMPASYRLNVSIEKSSTGPVSKTVTFDFSVKEPYGYTKNYSFANNAEIATEDGFTLKTGSTGNSYVLDQGVKIKTNGGKLVIISNNDLPISNVTYTCTTDTYGMVVVKKVSDTEWSITNNDPMDTYTFPTITVEYVDDGLEAAGIAFPAATLTLTNGVGEFEGLVLENPNNVPVTYTSSTPDVIVNENGGISLAEGVNGTTATITATFAGNDTYRSAEASYTLTVIPAVNSINELKEYANANDIKAYVNFESVTVFRNGNFTYIQSLDGTQFTEIYQSTTYNPGDVIPMGWTATATKNSNGFMQYKMSNMPESTETKEPVVETVTAVTTEDATKVVILKDVEITDEVLAKMPNGTAGSAYNVTAGGKTYNVYNQFKVVKVEEAGNYDMKCSVMVFSNAVRLYPIEFTKATVAPEPVSGTATFDFEANDYGFGRDATTFTVNGQIIKEDIASATFIKGSGNGWRMWTDGLRVYKGDDNGLNISVEGAQINKVTINAAKTLGTVSCNGSTLTYADKQYVWTGEAESANFLLTPTSNNAIQSIVVEYTILAPGKEPAGIEFESAVYTAGDNQKYYNGAVLINPNKLAVTWTSSDESVATVDNDGYVTIMSVGKTVITASSEETADFAAGKASYELNVVPAASTVPQMLAKAPNKGDQVLMNGELYVTYANGSYVYVYDGDDATLLYGSNNYATGDVIPGGWIATNAEYNGLLEWSGNFPAANGNMAGYLNYPEVEGLTTADVNRVVTIPNVEFAENTPEEKQSVDIKLPDGSSIALYNQFGIAPVAAGTYNVVAAVTLYKDAVQLYPIEYKEAEGDVDPVFPESFVITHNGSDESITITQQEQYGEFYINVEGSVAADNFVMTIEVPKGYTTFMFTDDDPDVEISSSASGDISTMMRRANTPYWLPIADSLAYGYALGNVLSVKANNVKAMPYGYLVKGDQFDTNNCINVNVRVDKQIVGVEAIEAAEEGARYFTMDGVEVKNPAEGIYIKVVDGKATKVVRK